MVTTTWSTIILTILSTIAGSSAIFAFIQFMIERKDRRSVQYSKLRENIQSIEKKLDKLDEKIEKSEALNARSRILRSSDELRRDIEHSKEFFDQLNEDIDTYEKYCIEHPDFKNNKAVFSIKLINEVYQDCLRNNSFL